MSRKKEKHNPFWANWRTQIDQKDFPVTAALKEKMPGEGILVTAIFSLTDPAQIQLFGSELTRLYARYGNSKEVRDHAAEIAGGNIGYTLGYFDRDIQQRWSAALAQIRTGIAALPQTRDLDDFLRNPDEILSETNRNVS